MTTSINVLDSVVSEKITDISSGLLEAGVDEFFDDDFLKHIPIVGTITKAFYLSQKLSAYFFTKKVLSFLFQLKNIPQLEREMFVQKMGSVKYQKQTGQSILLIINRLDDINKANILGKLFKALIQGYISHDDFIRLSHITEKTFINDLLLLNTTKGYPRITKENQQNLYQAGLLDQTIKDNRREEERESKILGQKRFLPPSIVYQQNKYAKMLSQFGFHD